MKQKSTFTNSTQQDYWESNTLTVLIYNMVKKIRPSKFISLFLLLIASVLFLASCRKPNSEASADRQNTSGLASLSDISSLASSTIGTLRVVTLAGDGTPGYLDGTNIATKFNLPSGVAMDASGNLYVADAQNHRVRKITSAGVVSTLAGNGTPGTATGIGTAAQFNTPSGVAVDASGNVYVADKANHAIRKISPAGEVTNFAGIPNPLGQGSTDGPGSTARFNSPSGVAVNASGNIIYVADAGNHKIRKITVSGTTVSVSTFAGNGSPGTGEGFATFAQFNTPLGVAVDTAGIVYVADAGNNKIRKIVSSTVSTLAGGGGTTSKIAGFLDATGTAALFNEPTGVTVDTSGNVWVADKLNHAIRQVTATGVVTTLTGNGTAAFVDGLPSEARFNSPTSIAVDASGKLFVADQNNYRIRRIAPPTIMVSTLAGNGVAGRVNAIGTAAQFSYPAGLYAGANNLLVGEVGNNDIRSISLSDFSVTTGLGFQGVAGYQNGFFQGAAFHNPSSVTFVPSSSALFISDMYNHSIRQRLGFYVYGYAGSTTPGYADGQNSNARFTYPAGITSDAAGNLYVADYGNNRIRKISPSGYVSTLAGGGFGFADGQGTAAGFNGPYGIAVDANGNVYVADSYNNRIRKISPSGFVTTLAGGNAGFVNGTSTSAQFYHPQGVAVDAAGNVYVADVYNNAVRMISASGIVSTLAGTGAAGYKDGLGNDALFYAPIGIAVDPSGNVYVSEYYSHRIRKISIQ